MVAVGLGQRAPDHAAAGTTSPPLSQEAQPPTTTSLPPPPALEDAVPFAARGLTLVILSDTGARAGVWHPNLATPSFNAEFSPAAAAAVNSDGTRISVEGTGETIVDVALGGNPQFLGGGGLWHPSDPDLFAWVESDPGSDETVIRTVDISAAETSHEIVPLLEFSVPFSDASLAAWGDWGFAVVFSETIHIFDPDGVPVRNAEGEVLDAANDGTLLVADGNGPPFVLNADGSTTALPSLDVGASDYIITPAGDWAIAVTPQEDGHTSILARAVNSRSTRITSVDQAARVVGVSPTGQVLILQSAETNGLFFKEWKTGVEYELSTHFRVAAIYVEDGGI